MHLLPVVTWRSHLWLRLGAVALLAALAVWPRASRSGTDLTAANAIRGAHGAHGVAARAETTAARLLSSPRTEKVVVAEADESQLTN